MATVSSLYDGSAVTLTTTALSSIAANTWWQSAAIDNTSAGTPSTSISDLSLDCLVEVKLVASATTPVADKAAYVYAYGSVDGSTYPDAITGSQGTFTANNPTQLRLLGTIFIPTASLTYISEPFSIASAFAGSMPAKWGIAVWNNSAALGAGCVVLYQALKQTVV